MKRQIKKLVFLFLFMSFLATAEEKTCLDKNKCLSKPVVAAKNNENNSNINTDNELLLMPISQFIIVQ